MRFEIKNQSYTKVINVCTLHDAYARLRIHIMFTDFVDIEYARIKTRNDMNFIIKKTMSKISIKMKLRRNSCL